jgi:hypothetical protein
MGSVTPTKIVSYSLLAAGFGLLLARAAAPALRDDFWTGVALLLIAGSFLVDLLPGGSELSDEQAVMIRHIGLPYRPGAEKWVSLIAGLGLLAIGGYLILSGS